MAGQQHRQLVLSERDKAVAEALGKEVAALLRPVLEERNRRLGEMCEHLDAVTTELAGACASLARMVGAAAGAEQPASRKGPE